MSVRKISVGTLASGVGVARMAVAAAHFLKPDPGAPAIDVRVVIPARDECETIEACVASVLSQTSEVVVVDDDSSDSTGDLAARAGAQVTRLEGDPPVDWLGKPRACAAGAEGATTEWLAFVDADVVLHPLALATMAAATGRTSISIAGGLECRTFWERLLLPELGLALVQGGMPQDFASGQCFLVRRDHYDAIGGHGHPAVRRSVIDDRDLARALGDHDARLAPDLMRARMYRDFAALRAGLTKNQAALYDRPLPHLANLLLPVAARRPWAAMAVSAGGRAVSGQNPAFGLLAPAARAVLAALYLESLWRAHAGKPVDWKSRPVRAD
ncbi:MAG TPA: glycosyltransferase [Acidimicrobiales bacterium]|nr:glycosyltransferase [Acidimicrobiales bacterium]